MWNPEVIIANENTAMKYILGNPQWSGIEAVKGRVYQLPHGISRWGHLLGGNTAGNTMDAKTVYGIVGFITWKKRLNIL